jgi:excisionase family DNA binding protein
MPRSDAAWLSISAAARALGVSTSTLRAWAAEGHIPHVRTAGGHRRFNPDALAGWLAERPEPGLPREERTTHVARSPRAADALIARAARIADLAVDDLIPAASDAFSHFTAGERRQAAADWVVVVAHALRTGRMGDALERADAYGSTHGASGSAAESALTGAMAMERAVDQALAEDPDPLPQDERDHVVATVRRLTVRIADAWARATPDGRAEVLGGT